MGQLYLYGCAECGKPGFARTSDQTHIYDKVKDKLPNKKREDFGPKCKKCGAPWRLVDLTEDNGGDNE